MFKIIEFRQRLSFTDEQVFYDKFLCDKFYLLVCTRKFDNFFYDKCTCSKASMPAFEQVHLS
jgi:hypothetical protein